MVKKMIIIVSIAVALIGVVVGCALWNKSSKKIATGGVDPSRVFSNARMIEFCVALQGNNLKAVQKEIAAGIDVNTVGDMPSGKSMTPIVFAVLAPTVEPLRAILAAGANPNVIYDGKTSPLFFAISKINPEFVKILLDAKANPNGPAPSGSLLGHGMISGRDPAVKMLLEAGADPNGTHDDDSLLINSVYWEKLRYMPLLIEKGANVKPEELEELCSYGGSIAKNLDRNGEYFRNYQAAWDYLEKKGFTPPCARVK